MPPVCMFGDLNSSLPNLENHAQYSPISSTTTSNLHRKTSVNPSSPFKTSRSCPPSSSHSTSSPRPQHLKLYRCTVQDDHLSTPPWISHHYHRPILDINQLTRRATHLRHLRTLLRLGVKTTFPCRHQQPSKQQSLDHSTLVHRSCSSSNDSTNDHSSSSTVRVCL